MIKIVKILKVSTVKIEVSLWPKAAGAHQTALSTLTPADPYWPFSLDLDKQMGIGIS